MLNSFSVLVFSCLSYVSVKKEKAVRRWSTRSPSLPSLHWSHRSPHQWTKRLPRKDMFFLCGCVHRLGLDAPATLVRACVRTCMYLCVRVSACVHTCLCARMNVCSGGREWRRATNRHENISDLKWTTNFKDLKISHKHSIPGMNNRHSRSQMNHKLPKTQLKMILCRQARAV